MNEKTLKQAVELFEDDIATGNYKHIIESRKRIDIISTLFLGLQQAGVYPFNQLPDGFYWGALILDLVNLRKGFGEGRTRWASDYIRNNHTHADLNHVVNVLFVLGVPYIYEVDESVTGVKDYVYSYYDVDDFIQDKNWSRGSYNKDMFTRVLNEVA